MKILESASKIVFVALTAALIAGLFVGKVESADFIMLTGMAFTYYFAARSQKG